MTAERDSVLALECTVCTDSSISIQPDELNGKCRELQPSTAAFIILMTMKSLKKKVPKNYLKGEKCLCFETFPLGNKRVGNLPGLAGNFPKCLFRE